MVPETLSLLTDHCIFPVRCSRARLHLLELITPPVTWEHLGRMEEGEEPAGDEADSQQQSAAEGCSESVFPPPFSFPPLCKHMLNPSVASWLVPLIWSSHTHLDTSLQVGARYDGFFSGWLGQVTQSTYRHFVSQLLPTAEGFNFCECAHVLFTCEPSKTASVPCEVNSKDEVIAHKGMKVCVVQMRGSMLVSLWWCETRSSLDTLLHTKLAQVSKKKKKVCN